jgi:iron complex outermembrane receptor protein
MYLFMRFAFPFLLLHISIMGFTQNSEQDSSKTLQAVLIQAYATGRPLNEVPAAVGYINTESLNRFSNTSILPAINTMPGVRMEERSPGSYRFSIRGSALRSPFGVRNVKMYWNGLPLTDGGGNTYLNLIDFNSIGSMEVIKGPGGSLYGAGTGGVVLLNSPLVKQGQSELSALVGSYGLHRLQLSHQLHSKNFNLRLQYANQNYDGYREQTAMSRQSVNADMTLLLSEKSTLSAAFFYTDLSYQTPGGLTKVQYDANPKQARPPGGPNRGAVEQKAAVYNRTPYLGISYDYDWNDQWSTRVALFGSRSQFENPTIRNYELRDERNAGARTETQYKFGNDRWKSKLTFGGEYQAFRSPIQDYGNTNGVKDTIQTEDDLSSRLLLFFAQTELDLPSGFYLTIGASVNFVSYDFTRYQPTPVTVQHKNFDAVFLPRIALLKKLNDNLSIYTSASRGFSPPSLAEVRPSTNTFNSSLQAEKGTNYEFGFRGRALQQKLSWDIALYDFRLNPTIIVQHTADGADYFINSGKTSQQGIEATVSWNAVRTAAGFITNLKIWTSYTYNHYRFREYIQDQSDFSGNKLTGTPPTVNTAGLDVMIKQKIYFNVTSNYVDHIPLNDANSVYAAEYFLLGGRLGFRGPIIKRNPMDVFLGVDNALNKQYSLGNDLNAVGGRYFNAAPNINFYAGLKLTLIR